MGRPQGSENKDKPVRQALRMEVALAEQGLPCEAPQGSLRWAARQLLIRAADDNAAFGQLADRLDGKPAQVIEDSQGNELQFLGEQEMTVEFTRLIQDLNLGETTKLTVRKHVKAPRKLNGHSED